MSSSAPMDKTTSPPTEGPVPTPVSAPSDLTSGVEGERRKIAGRAGIVALGTLSSRALGLVRDQVIAAIFTRATTDVFFVAFTIPNVLRQLLAEGAVQNAVLPVLEATKAQQGDQAAHRLFVLLRGISLIVLFLVTCLGCFAAPYLVELFATGYHQHGDQYQRTVTLTRWLFPYIFWMGSAALGIAALNLHRRFVVSSFAPGLLNVAFIVTAFVLPTWLKARGEDPALALAFGALIGGLLQVVAQWPSLARIGYLNLPRLSLSDPGVREVFRRMGPVLFGVGVYYIDVVLARRFLSELEVGAQSYFAWAMRLCDFPQGIFVMALQSATLPSLAKLVAQGQLDEVRRTFVYALRLTLFVALTASVACLVLAEPIVVLLFQRGEFDATSSQQTARALVAQGAGIWMVAAVRQLVAVYFSFGDTKTPVRVAAIDLGVFALSAWLLRPWLGHVGVSWAVTLASATQMALLWRGVGRRLGTTGLSEILPSALRTLVASLGAAAVGWLVFHLLADYVRDHKTAVNLLVLLLFVVVFLGLARCLGCGELDLLPGFRGKKSRS